MVQAQRRNVRVGYTTDGDVVALVTLDFILRLVLAGVMRVAFVGNVRGVFFDNRSADVPRLRVPHHAIADLQVPCHGSSTPVPIVPDQA